MHFEAKQRRLAFLLNERLRSSADCALLTPESFPSTPTVREICADRSNHSFLANQFKQGAPMPNAFRPMGSASSRQVAKNVLHPKT